MGLCPCSIRYAYVQEHPNVICTYIVALSITQLKMSQAERKFTFYWKSNTRLLADFRKVGPDQLPRPRARF